jgi:putative transposase
MSELYQSLSYSKWDCNGDGKPSLAKRAGNRARSSTLWPGRKSASSSRGTLMPDHVHMCIAIPRKPPVSSVIGFLKGKSAIAIARLCGKERNFTGEHFWARGYPVSTVGFELEQVRT